jgi:hypothetical protein
LTMTTSVAVVTTTTFVLDESEDEINSGQDVADNNEDRY